MAAFLELMKLILHFNELFTKGHKESINSICDLIGCKSCHRLYLFHAINILACKIKVKLQDEEVKVVFFGDQFGQNLITIGTPVSSSIF